MGGLGSGRKRREIKYKPVSKEQALKDGQDLDACGPHNKRSHGGKALSQTGFVKHCARCTLLKNLKREEA